MSDKSHVGMGVSVCPVCLHEHDEVVLIDKRLRKTLRRHEFMGWDLCPVHKKMHDDGYVALVECGGPNPGINSPGRTGVVAHIRASVWPDVFNVPVPPGGVALVPPEVIKMLQQMTPGAQDEKQEHQPTSVH